MHTQYKAIKKTSQNFQTNFDDAHLLNFFSHLLPTLRIHPKIRLHFYSAVTSFFVWKVLVSTSIDVRETCTDHTKYKAIKRIHSCILPKKINNNPKIGDGIQTSSLMLPTSQILVTLADAVIAAHLLLKHPEIWGTFYSAVTRLTKTGLVSIDVQKDTYR